MAHVLIAGMTLSGKSTLAKARARAFKAQGISVLVCDPICDPDWQADFITRDQEKFLRVYWLNERCMVFFDEGSKSVGKYNLATEDTATLGRHRGHVNHYIVQRVQQIPPIVRDQCTELFLFRSSRKDGEMLADEWAIDALRECAELPMLAYIHAKRDGSFSLKHLQKGKRYEYPGNDSRSGNRGNRRTHGTGKESDESRANPSSGEEQKGGRIEHGNEGNEAG